MKTISFISLFFLSLFYNKAEGQSSGEYIYWTVLNFTDVPSKTKRIIYFNEQESLEKLLYVIPAGAADSTGPKVETRVNEQGESINKVSLNLGPTEAYAPQEHFVYYKSLSKRNTVLHRVRVYKARGNGKGDDYVLEDKGIDFGWRITEERKSIGGYECIKAVSKPFRGRVYEAWFAPAIPISNGPWKLCGLPGLILEAADQSGEVAFIFEGLKLLPEAQPVRKYYTEIDLPRISWKEYVRRIKEEENKVFKSVMAQGGHIRSSFKKELESTAE
jgi:GLPGLI family protein